MNIIKEKINKIISVLSESDELKNINIITAYPKDDKPTVIRKPKISVGLQKMSIDENMFMDNCRKMQITLNINVYVPINCDSVEATEIFMKIVDILAMNNDLSMAQVKCFDPCYSREIYSFMLKSEISFNDVLYYY